MRRNDVGIRSLADANSLVKRRDCRFERIAKFRVPRADRPAQLLRRVFFSDSSSVLRRIEFSKYHRLEIANSLNVDNWRYARASKVESPADSKFKFSNRNVDDV